MNCRKSQIELKFNFGSGSRAKIITALMRNGEETDRVQWCVVVASTHYYLVDSAQVIRRLSFPAPMDKTERRKWERQRQRRSVLSKWRPQSRPWQERPAGLKLRVTKCSLWRNPYFLSNLYSLSWIYYFNSKKIYVFCSWWPIYKPYHALSLSMALLCPVPFIAPDSYPLTCLYSACVCLRVCVGRWESWRLSFACFVWEDAACSGRGSRQWCSMTWILEPARACPRIHPYLPARHSRATVTRPPAILCCCGRRVRERGRETDRQRDTGQRNG